MASFYPLIINPIARTINELAAGDAMDMTNSDIVNLSNLEFLAQGSVLGNVSFSGGVVDLGDVPNVSIQGGLDKTFLQTDGTGNLTWAVPSLTVLSNGNTSITLLEDSNINFNVNNQANVATLTMNSFIVDGNILADNFVGQLANGNSNIRIDANANVAITSNGLSNVFIVSSNGIHGVTRVQDDLIVTGNLTVAGNTSYVQANSLVVQDPIIEVGGGANGAPLVANDGKDRGLLVHYYTTTPVDAFIGWKNANAEWIVTSNVTSANDIIGVNSLGNIRASYFIGANGILSLANITATNSFNAPNANITGLLRAPAIDGALVGANGSTTSRVRIVAGNVQTSANNNVVIDVLANGSGANIIGTLGTNTLVVTSGVVGNLINGTSSVNVEANANVSITARGNTIVNFTSSANGNVQTTGINVFGYINALGNINSSNFVGALANGLSNVAIPAVNGNINLTANGIANVLVVGAGSSSNNFILTRGNANITGNLHVLPGSSLRLASNVGASTQWASIKASTAAGFTANYTLTLPTAVGSGDQWLMTDSAGNLRFSNTFVKFNETVVTATNVSGIITPNLNAGTIFRYTLNGALTINTMANVTAGSSAIIVLQQDAAGGRTVTWGSAWRFAGNVRALTATPGSIDVAAVFYDGTNYLASLTRGYV